MTPMMQQYLEIKSRYPEALLLYRMGDFYELFFDDAIFASECLSIALTKRGQHEGQDVPMAGIPVHAYSSYIAKLVSSGRHIAICEQKETPEEAKKRAGYKALVHREVVQVITPGTITDDQLLDSSLCNHLISLVFHGTDVSVSWADISTGHFYVRTIPEARALSFVLMLDPKEILVSQNVFNAVWFLEQFSEILSLVVTQNEAFYATGRAERVLCDFYGVQYKGVLDCFKANEIKAAGVLLGYVISMQVSALPRMNWLVSQNHIDSMELNYATWNNLELFQTLSGSKRGSLLSFFNLTGSPQGGRLLHRWLAEPLICVKEINKRLDVVDFFLADSDCLLRIADLLKAVPDVERIVSKLSLNRVGPRDLQKIASALRVSLEIASLIENLNLPDLVSGMHSQLQEVEGIASLLFHALADEVPFSCSEGGVFVSGYDASLDYFRTLVDQADALIENLEKRYRQSLSLDSMKIVHNNILGYFCEISRRHAEKVGTDFEHIQTLSQVVRYRTKELSQLEKEIEQARIRSLAREEELMNNLLLHVKEESNRILCVASCLAQLDCLVSFALLAYRENYVRPVVTEDFDFYVEEGRHPIVEKNLREKGQSFIANDCCLEKKRKITLITGANMSGKSTFMRQNAILAIMAHMGMFVPARKFRVGLIDKLFTRVGAGDDLARGQSTFMTEMLETATILKQATSRSFVIFDEVGRGTSVTDGLAIAQAVVEYLHDRITPRCFFATHYHSLTVLEKNHQALSCGCMKSEKIGEKVLFSHVFHEGISEDSYGINVAFLAGFPEEVVERACVLRNKAIEEESCLLSGL